MSRPLAVAVLLVVALALAATPAHGAPPTGAAPDGPGRPLALRPRAQGLRRHRAQRGSKVWFTVADGVLSDVYFPTNDNTNNETLQYVVTDGSTFTDLQTRDMTYTVEAPDDRSLSCRVTARDKNGRYKIVTDYVTDTEREAVVMRSRFIALKGKPRDYKLYVRFDPTLNGNGGGGTGNGGPDSGAIATSGGHTLLVGSDPVTTTNAANRDYAVPVHTALDADAGFLEVSNGFAGSPATVSSSSTPTRRLTAAYADGGDRQPRADRARRPRPHDGDVRRSRSASADTQAGAVSTARGSAQGRASDDLSRAYDRSWHRYDDDLDRAAAPEGRLAAPLATRCVDEYYLSANYVKAAEDKTFPGAVAAALASPWGQAVSAGDPANTYFGSYREVFARDLYEAWTALLVAGDRATARDDDALPVRAPAAPRRLDAAQQPHQRQAGARLVQHPARRVRLPARDGARRRADRAKQYYKDHIAGGELRRHPRPVVRPGALGGAERLLALDDLRRDRRPAGGGQDRRRATATTARRACGAATADEFQRNLKRWTLTTNGPLSPDPYFIRLSKNGDPNERLLQRRQRRPDARPARDHRRRLPRVRAPRRARRGRPGHRALAGHRRRDDQPHAPTPATASYRYNGDGYGDGSTDGHPWAPSNMGNGHLWPVLAGERGSGSSTAATSARRSAGSRRCTAGARRRADPRAGVGAARPRPVAVRHRPDDSVDRLRERQARRLGRGADVVGGPVRAPDADVVGRADRSTARATLRALRQAHAGQPPPDRHRAGRRARRSARPVDGDRHVGARQHGSRSRPPTSTPDRPATTLHRDDGRRRAARSASRSR